MVRDTFRRERLGALQICANYYAFRSDEIAQPAIYSNPIYTRGMGSL